MMSLLTVWSASSFSKPNFWTAVDAGGRAPGGVDGVLLQVGEARVDALDGLVRLVGSDNNYQLYPIYRRPLGALLR
jgi:hypothetical protein